MKKIMLALSFMLCCTLTIYAQSTQTRAAGESSVQGSASINKDQKQLQLETGTRVAAELQDKIDVRKAQIGDQVILKTTEAIKSGGDTIVNKGARLIGHVTSVSEKTKDRSVSHVEILFDRLEHGSLSMPITATISSISSTTTRADLNDDNSFGASATGRSTTTASSAGLLGGVVNSTTSTVSSVVGATTAAVGSTVNSTTNAAGATAAGLGSSPGAIRISESSNTSLDGGTRLSLNGGNLRLEKGTQFNLVLTQSASAGASRDQ